MSREPGAVHIAQNGYYENFLGYFMVVLGAKSQSHPAIARLLHAAGLIVLVVSMYWKANVKKQGGNNNPHPRPRPYQLCPALLPPVEVPGHPSYPSGHACQSLLMALFAEDALPNTLPAAQKEKYRQLLQTLAHRIAWNREIAGLHCSSDTSAGFDLAK